MVEINWQPNTRQLRQFGWAALVALPTLGWFWSGGSPTTTLSMAVAGLFAAMSAVFLPNLLKYPFLILSVIALPIGLVVSELILFIIYAGLFVPLGLIGRLVGRDALAMKLEPTRSSYWQEKEQPTNVDSYFRQW